MPAIVPVATAVLPGNGAGILTGQIIGETFTAGAAVYKKGSDQRWYKAKASGTADESGAGVSLGLGIALSGGAAGQRCEVQTSGPIALGVTLVIGVIYCVGPTLAGDIAPNADIVSPDYVSILGVAISATQILLTPMATGVVHG